MCASPESDSFNSVLIFVFVPKIATASDVWKRPFVELLALVNSFRSTHWSFEANGNSNRVPLGSKALAEKD